MERQEVLEKEEVSAQAEKEEEEQPEGLRREARALLRLALPLAGIQFGNHLMGVVDTIVVGRLGEKALAAVSLGHVLYFGISVFGIGIIFGLDPLISQALGAGREARARALLWQGAWLSLFVSLALSGPVFFSPLLLEPVGIAPDVAAEAALYLRVRLLGFLPLLLFLTVRSYLQARGLLRPLVIGMIGANVLNLGATILLVHGGGVLPTWCGPLRGIPAWGIAGSAVASTVALLLQVGVVVLAVGLLGEGGLRFRGPRRDDLRTTLRVGLPLGLQLTAEVGSFALVGLLAGRLGSMHVAAHQIALSLASLSFTGAIGLSAAASVRVGRAIGRRNHRAARGSGFLAIGFGGLVMGVAGLGFWLFASPLARIFTADPDVLGVVVPLLFVAAWFQVSDGVQGVASGVLRGAGDTRFSFLMNLAGHYGVGLPIALLLGLHWNQGVTGLWWGLFAGLTVVAAGYLVRFHRLSSRPIRPVEEGPDA